METFHTIELNQLDLRYAHTRIYRKNALFKMSDSIERFGQITPAGVVAEGDRFILVDGYLRAYALKRSGKDTIDARVLATDLTSALIEMLSQQKRRDAIEEAGILRELHLGQGLSQAKIAGLLGKNPSWVSRRLSLLEVLTGDLLDAVLKDKISTWAACRVLVPMARANFEHAEKLLENLDAHPLSSRDFARFYAHYKEANRKVRENMVAAPGLFIKTIDSQIDLACAKALKNGPEGAWLKDMTVITHILSRLIKKVDAVFYPGQTNLDRRRLLTALSEGNRLFSTLQEKINHEIARTSPDHHRAFREGSSHPQDLSDAPYLAQHGEESHQGEEKISEGL